MGSVCLRATVKTTSKPDSVLRLFPSRRFVNGKTELDLPIDPYPTKAGWDAPHSNGSTVGVAH